MSNTIVTPSLSPLGWITDAQQKADVLLAHFFESEYSQTYLYSKNISSLQYIIQAYGNNMLTLTTKLQEVLETYLSRYFDIALVKVTNNDNATNLTGDVTITVSCQISQNGQLFDVAQSINVVNSKLVKVIKLNNFGA